jgi:hypothetical protein
MKAPHRDTFRFVAGIALRLVLLIAFVVVAAQLANPDNQTAVHRALALATLAYIFLTALPFVPGAEIGMAMLTVFGAYVAPLVYGATVVSLLISYTVGRTISPQATAALLSRIGLKRAAALVAQTMGLPRKDRLAHMLQSVDSRHAKFLTRYRYVALALIINIPGNTVFGGGGGLALAAGLSGVFSPLPFFLTILIAVLPIPLAVHMIG